MFRRSTFVLLFLVTVFAAGVLQAQVTPPDSINLQGRLTDSSNNEIDGTADMEFILYDAASGGTVLLTDTHSGGATVQVNQGHYSVELGGGSVTAGSETTLGAVFANNIGVFVEVRVHNGSSWESLNPRVPLYSVGHALNAATLEGFSASDFVQSSGAAVTLNSVPYAFPGADGTSGQVLTTDGGGGLTWSTQTASAGGWTDNGTDVVLTGTTDNVGIGSSVPGAVLDVVGGSPRFTGSTTSSGLFLINNAASTVEWGVNVDSSGAFFLRDIAGGLQTRLLIDGSGNVGIGSTSPQAKLDIAGTVRVDGVTYDFPNADGSSGDVLVTDGSGGLSWATPSGGGGAGGWTDTGSAVILTTSTDLVGIGTSNPAAELDILGSAIHIKGDSTSTVRLELDQSGFGGHNYAISSDSNGVFFLRDITASGATRFVVDPNGNFGIGSTSPAAKLDVSGTVRFDGVTYDFPNTDGANGDVLVTNGSGGLSWTTPPSGGGGPWTDSGGDAILSSGNVGIGTATAASALHVRRNGANVSTITSNLILETDPGTAGANGIGGFIYFGHKDSSNTMADATYLISQFNNATAGALQSSFQIRLRDGASMVNRFYLQSDGNLGLGTSGPTHNLHIWKNTNVVQRMVVENVSGGTQAQAQIGAGNGSGTIGISTFGVGNTDLAFNSAATPNYGRLRTDSTLDGMIITTGGTGDPMRFGISDTEVARIDGNGNLGIGSTSPQAKLDVAGTVRVDGVTYDFPNADGTSGDVLTTNGSGTLSWAAAGGGGGLWTDAGTTTHVNTGDHVGIGTTNAGAELHVHAGAMTGSESGSIFAADLSGGSSMSSTLLLSSTGTDGNPIRLGFWDANAGVFAGSIDGHHIPSGSGGGGYLAFRIIQAGDASIVERMRITRDGNVGIGVTSPAHLLAVAGNIEIDDAAGANLVLSENGLQRSGTNTDFVFNLDNTAVGHSLIKFLNADSVEHTHVLIEGTFSVSNEVGGPSAVPYNRLGTNTTGHLAGAVGEDLLISGSLEVDTTTYLDGGLSVGNGDIISQYISVNAGTWSGGSISPGQTSFETFSVSGAAIGDVVAVSIDNMTTPGAYQVSGYVDAANSVTVVVTNHGGAGALNITGGNVRISVFQH